MVTPSAVATKRLSRMVAAHVYPELDNEALTDALSTYALRDSAGNAPGVGAWVETFDVYGAAAECIRWKLAAAVADVSFTADGANTTLNQLTEHLNSMLRDFENRRVTGTITVTPYALT